MRVLSWRLGIRPSNTRIPFKYGKASLTECPQALLELVLEIQGNVIRGYAADCLPPLWFDKSEDRGFGEQIEDMLDVITIAASALSDFGVIESVGEAVRVLWSTPGLSGRPQLLTSFGHSMAERCLIDALCRKSNCSFRKILSTGALYGDFVTELNARGHKRNISPWQHDHSSERIAVRHTVGLGDPLSNSEQQLDDGISDGLPATLEDHLRHNGIRYLKVKIGNRGLEDIQRLMAIWRVCELTAGWKISFTLDGNEQYSSIEEFEEFWSQLRSIPELRMFTDNVIAVEQPLNRMVALDETATSGLREFSSVVPVIIDESDAAKDDCWQALCLGYSGTSSKACKGVTKALINRQLIAECQNEQEERQFLVTGEDLCCVGVVALQTDLALVSVMGLTHVERNGHHYHSGLNYLSRGCYEEIIQQHGDLYQLVNGVPALKIEQGSLCVRTVNENGFGFSVDPRFDTYELIRYGE
ncbi:MAG: hypothetical protein CMJ76_09185 [Planctomycetaceae bacterium]|nr:hypothetical protein [Planctomycetaceae bacterium]